MRILELNFEKHWRGGERQTIYCIRGLLREGHEATLLCREDSPLAKKANQVGIITIECSGVFQVVKFLLAHAKEYTILHCQTSNMLTYCMATKWLHKRPVVLSRRVSYVPKGFFTMLKYKSASKIIAISNTVKSILLKQGIKNVSVIGDVAVPVSQDVKRAEGLMASYNCNNKKVIATMAALETEKDPFTMIEAIRKLAVERKDFVFFHFGGGSLLEAVRAKIHEYGLDKIYHSVGFMENVTDFFSVIDVFAFSSIEEGLGSSILDAFLYKVPVATTDGGGLKDLVTSDRGMISPIKNPDQLASNINRLMDDISLRKEIVNNAYNYVLAMHSLEYITDLYVKEFQRILNGLPSPF